tara:strand:- start:126 stop:494 length:369 start_codon:yes stop_codon:yes gene_type:complete
LEILFVRFEINSLCNEKLDHSSYLSKLINGATFIPQRNTLLVVFGKLKSLKYNLKEKSSIGNLTEYLFLEIHFLNIKSFFNEILVKTGINDMPLFKFIFFKNFPKKGSENPLESKHLESIKL